MAGTTTKGFRYPSNGDSPNVAVDIQNLASDVDTGLNSYLTTATAASTYATVSALDTTEDFSRTTMLLLGGM